ncbi:hypothetical protein C9374_001021 [Naegleria lovaniensis]|uniref:Uncharacterized protein n=1 Tax=Naegleria lovaniensis TaxID=51637 RepID=A0AA88GTL3_NAELO|nr:uncharacterized protein C9374_001021 [Naegleria lovaniensis]KAG2388171.1 hypothetical protein C9374_001021 [Naegleria lovaniensis]
MMSNQFSAFVNNAASSSCKNAFGMLKKKQFCCSFSLAQSNGRWMNQSSKLFNNWPSSFWMQKSSSESLVRCFSTIMNVHRNSSREKTTYYDTNLLPEWFKTSLYNNEAAKKALSEFDVEFYDKPFIKTFPDVDKNPHETPGLDKTMFHLRPESLSDADLSKLCFVQRGKTKDYICVGEAYYFPLFRDLPVHYTPSCPSLLYIEIPDSSGKEQTPKILYQIAPFVPPMFWIPLKPSSESLARLFDEIMDIETNNVTRHIQFHENLLSHIGFKLEKLKELENDPKSAEKVYNELHIKFLDYINKTLDPNKLEFKERVLQEYPNQVYLFLGNVPKLELLEQSFMNNPFVFNTPVLLGSSNRFVSSESVQTSMFYTVFSRSLIILEARFDLHVDFSSNSSDVMVPIFARVMYPSNQRLSKPCPERMNKVLGSNFPADMPIDVCLALFGQKNSNAETIASELLEQVKSDEEMVKAGMMENIPENMFNPSIPIAHLAILRYGKWKTEIFDRFKRHSIPSVRIACVKGCLELNMLEELKAFRSSETHHEVLQYVDESITRLEKKIELMKMKEKDEADELEKRNKKLEEENQQQEQ